MKVIQMISVLCVITAVDYSLTISLCFSL